MINYIGDFPEDATLYIPFNTFSSDDPSASVTITDLVDADIKVHKNSGTTEIATDGATVAINFDGVTGNHLVTIDTSAHSDYATGADYFVRMEGTTVDGATINAWIGHFSIENRYVRVDEIAANAITATAINADAITSAKIADNALANEHFADGALTSTEVTSVGSVTGHTAQTGDTYALANGATGFEAIDTVVDGIQTDLSNGTDGLGALKTLIDTLDNFVDTEVAAILALLDDARAEPGQGAPPVNPDTVTKIDYLYKAWRNKTLQSATEYKLYNDAGDTIDQKATVSDDATDFTRGEVGTGA